MAPARWIPIAFLAAAGLVVAGYVTRSRWLPAGNEQEARHAAGAPAEQILLSDQAQKNLRLVSAPLKPTTYWKTLQVPGAVIDRPGHSDRGIVAPAAAVVARVHRLPGETVRP